MFEHFITSVCLLLTILANSESNIQRKRDYIGGVITDREDLTLQTPESFKARFNIDVRVLNEAVKVSPDTKTVTVKNLRTGETYEETYDNLILSMGAEPIRPNIEGADGSNVFTLRNIRDTLKIKNYIDTAKPRSAVVIGGGYIGVEMAENLVETGLKVAIVELADHLIAPLDFDMAADVHRYIKSKGVYLHLNNGTLKIWFAVNKEIVLNTGKQFCFF